MNNKLIKFLSVLCAVALLAAAGWKLLPFAHAEQYSVGDAEITAPVRNLDVNWTSGKVNIAYHNQNTVLISEKTTGTVTEDMRMRWRLDGDTLRIEYEKPGFHLFSLFPHEKELTVTLPRGLTLETANISLTSGNLEAPDLYADRAKLETTSGDMRAEVTARIVQGKATSGNMDLIVKNTAEEIELKATSGSITLEAAGAEKKTSVEITSGVIRAKVGQTGKFRAKSTSGDMYALLGQAKETDLDSTSGKITVEIAAMDTLNVHATSGDVTAYLPAAPGFTARIETTSGRVEHTLPLTQNGKAYACGDGSGAVSIHTTSGNVTVNAKGN